MNLTILDTSVIQRIDSYGNAIFDGYMEKEWVESTIRKCGIREVSDIGALSGIMMANVHESITFAIPEYSLEETMRIKNADKRASRVNWLLQLYECWDYFRKDIGYDKLPTKIQVDEIISQNGLNFLKGDGDQIIVAEAIYYGCDSILHMDYKTISSRKKELTEIGITPYTPSEYCHKFGYIQRDFLREL